MNAIRSVFAALGNLAASINGMASVLDVATGRLRQQLALDYDPAVLPHNGEVIDTDDTPPAKGRKVKSWNARLRGRLARTTRQGFPPPCSFEGNVSDFVRFQRQPRRSCVRRHGLGGVPPPGRYAGHSGERTSLRTKFPHPGDRP